MTQLTTNGVIWCFLPIIERILSLSCAIIRFCCSSCCTLRSKFPCSSFRRCTDSSFSSLTLERNKDNNAFKYIFDKKEMTYKCAISTFRIHCDFKLITAYYHIMLVTLQVPQSSLQFVSYPQDRGPSKRLHSSLCCSQSSAVWIMVNKQKQLLIGCNEIQSFLSRNETFNLWYNEENSPIVYLWQSSMWLREGVHARYSNMLDWHFLFCKCPREMTFQMSLFSFCCLLCALIFTVEAMLHSELGSSFTRCTGAIWSETERHRSLNSSVNTWAS